MQETVTQGITVETIAILLVLSFTLISGFMLFSLREREGFTPTSVAKTLLISLVLLAVYFPIIMTLYYIAPAFMVSESPGIFVRILQDMNPLTVGFIAIILGFTIYFHTNYTPVTMHKAPALLTTLGILGTFVGIAVGLAHFSPYDIQNTVPTLIDGIKTAFWASAVGIFCAITVKFRDLLTENRRLRRTRKGVTVDDLVTTLAMLQQALAGEDEQSLLNQVKQARIDNNERLEKLTETIKTSEQASTAATIQHLANLKAAG